MNPERMSSPEQAPLPEVPKSRELFRGDINDAVIQTQLQTGVEIDKGWWDSEVGNHGSTESILERYDASYPEYVEQHIAPEPQEQKSAETDNTELEEDTEKADGQREIEARSEAAGYIAKIIRLPDAEQVIVETGQHPEEARFMHTAETPFVRSLGSYIRDFDGEGSNLNILPSAQRLNDAYEQIFPNSRERFNFVEAGDDVAEISAPEFFRYLANNQIPLAGIKDVNYFEHDRAIDDHILGTMLMPEEINGFIVEASKKIVDKGDTGEKTKTAIAAYDFLTATLTLYAWRSVNGENAPLPLRKGPDATLGENIRESEFRLSYAKEAMQQSIATIEEASGVVCPVTVESLDELLQPRIVRVKTWIKSRSQESK